MRAVFRDVIGMQAVFHKDAFLKQARSRFFWGPLLWVLWGTFVTAGGVMAEEVEGLYQADVPVSSQGRKERAQALGVALERVLIKVSGDAGVARYPGVKGALTSPLGYLQRYGYRTLTQTATEGQVAFQVLTVQFDPGAVNKLLRRAGLSVWPKARPAVLVWLAVERGGNRTLVSKSDEVARALEIEGERRGIPLIMPLLDLTDRSALSVSDLWGLFHDRISAASERYASQAILVGRAYNLGSGYWEINWSLSQEGEVETWVTRDKDLSKALEDGVDHVADALVDRYSRTLTVSGGEPVEILVRGVKNLADYARVQRYLDSLELVRLARVVRVEPGAAWFLVESDEGPGALAQTLALGDTLRAEATEDEWHYELLP